MLKVFLVSCALFAVPANKYPVDVISVHDGDTFTVDIKMDFGITLRHQTIRAADCDAWEISRVRKTVGEITEAELKKGAEAKAAVEKLFKENKITVSSHSPERDAYGRILGQVWVNQNGTDVPFGEWMKAKGYTRK